MDLSSNVQPQRSPGRDLAKQILDRLAADPHFADALVASPDAALAEAGLDASAPGQPQDADTLWAWPCATGTIVIEDALWAWPCATGTIVIEDALWAWPCATGTIVIDGSPAASCPSAN